MGELIERASAVKADNEGALKALTAEPGRPLPRLLSPAELADYLGIPLATVYRWRSRRDGPAGIRVGRHVRYRLEDVEGWLESLRESEA